MKETLHAYSRLLGAVAKAHAPKHPHWWHVALQVTPVGLRTAPIPVKEGSLDLELNLIEHVLRVRTSRGGRYEQQLRGQSLKEYACATLDFLGLELDRTPFSDASTRDYDRDAVGDLHRKLVEADQTLRRLRNGLPPETGPVNFWTHHFDLGLVWFSGRLVPGQDPKDLDNAREQMGFGFSFGDEGHPDPYWYVTAYPFPEGIEKKPLPAGGWSTEGFKGAVLGYGSGDALKFFRAAHGAGATLLSDA